MFNAYISYQLEWNAHIFYNHFHEEQFIVLYNCRGHNLNLQPNHLATYKPLILLMDLFCYNEEVKFQVLKHFFLQHSFGHWFLHQEWQNHFGFHEFENLKDLKSNISCVFWVWFHVIKNKTKIFTHYWSVFISMNVIKPSSSQVSFLPHSLIVWFLGSLKSWMFSDARSNKERIKNRAKNLPVLVEYFIWLRILVSGFLKLKNLKLKEPQVLVVSRTSKN